MSIESNLAELTAAVHALTKAIVASTGGTTKPVVTAEEVAAERTQNGGNIADAKAAAQAKKSAATEKAAADTLPTAEPAVAQTEKVTNSEAIDFATQVQAPIVKLAASGKRAEALAILGEFGAKRASDINPEDYARAVELIGQVA